MDTDFDQTTYEKALELDHKNLSDLAKKSFEFGSKLKLENIYQRRDYLKHITIIAVGLIALAPLVRDKVHIPLYFDIGVILIITTILFALMRVRENIDDDANNLENQLIERNIIDDLFELAREYLLKEHTRENAQKWISERNIKQAGLYKNEKILNISLDYLLEILIFLLVLGILFVLLSVSVVYPINLCLLVFSILLIFFFIFFVRTNYVFYPINYLLNLHRPRKYKGTIIQESLDDKNILDKFTTLRNRITDDAEWHLVTLLVTKKEILSLSNHLNANKWYMHFWDSKNNMIVVFKDKIFEFNYNDKSAWQPAIDHGVSLGIPVEQLDFLIN